MKRICALLRSAFKVLTTPFTWLCEFIDDEKEFTTDKKAIVAERLKGEKERWYTTHFHSSKEIRHWYHLRDRVTSLYGFGSETPSNFHPYLWDIKNSPTLNYRVRKVRLWEYMIWMEAWIRNGGRVSESKSNLRTGVLSRTRIYAVSNRTEIPMVYEGGKIGRRPNDFFIPRGFQAIFDYGVANRIYAMYGGEPSFSGSEPSANFSLGPSRFVLGGEYGGYFGAERDDSKLPVLYKDIRRLLLKMGMLTKEEIEKAIK